jgi:hypothetical protein
LLILFGEGIDRFMKWIGFIFLVGWVSLGLFVYSSLQAGEAGEVADPALEQARARALPVAQELMKTLEGRLMEAMGEGGPVAAIGVCREQAQALTETVRKEADIAYLKRVGVRIRNPENAPDAAEKRALDHFLNNGGGKGEYPSDWIDTIELPDGTEQIRYYKAIPTQARCLTCHGTEDNMPGVIREAIDARYPDDQARGFVQGDLRGLLVFGLEPLPKDASKR